MNSHEAKAFTASGIILLYLLWGAKPTHGETLNAVVFHAILGDSSFGKIGLLITLILEALLLFAAANTGFLAGPSVLANMAVDGWIPNRFRHLSTRLVIQNGLILFGIFSLLILYWSKGKVSLLVILYSINVFITFSLSLLGLCVYWATRRQAGSPHWKLRLGFSFFAFFITSSILCITLYSKFKSGGWVTILITCTVIGVCLLIKQYYNFIARKIAALNRDLSPPVHLEQTQLLEVDFDKPTAVIFIGKSIGVGMHTFLCVLRLFPKHFSNFVFVSAGIVDVSSFSGKQALEQMQTDVNSILQYFVSYCHQNGLASVAYAGYGTDTVEELSKLADDITEKFPNSIFFASKLIFEYDNLITRFLHNETAITLQRHLHSMGKELVILPVKI